MCQVKAKLNQNQYYYDGKNVIREREIYQGATVSNTYYHSLLTSLNRDISIRKGGIDYWYHTDPIGNVLFISDSTGSIIATYNQEAFGNIISSTGYVDNDLHLHERGQEDGYVDLYYFGARWYDPELGRWLSPEPLGLDGPNLYHFNFNDPVNGYDPNGLDYWEDILRDAGDYSAGFTDNITFGLTRVIRKANGADDFVDHCSSLYKAGELSGVAWNILLGYGAGIKAVGVKGSEMEFSHWIPVRWGGPRSIWNGNYVTPKIHYLSDPFRYPSGYKNWGPKMGVIRKQWTRLPYAYKGIIAGPTNSQANRMLNRLFRE